MDLQRGSTCHSNTKLMELISKQFKNYFFISYFRLQNYDSGTTVEHFPPGSAVWVWCSSINWDRTCLKYYERVGGAMPSHYHHPWGRATTPALHEQIWAPVSHEATWEPFNSCQFCTATKLLHFLLLSVAVFPGLCPCCNWGQYRCIFKQKLGMHPDSNASWFIIASLLDSGAYSQDIRESKLKLCT